MSDRVRVAVRIRPLISCEIENGAEIVVHSEREKRVRVAVPAKNTSFEFDWAFGSSIAQQRVYLETCQPLVESFFNGYNATVFAYGQTGSGKTYTMGNDGRESKEGLIPYTVNDIFRKCEILNDEGVTTKLTMSYLEIYKEECYDLLSINRIKCDIRESSKGDTYVEGLNHLEITEPDDVYKLLSDVTKLRATAKTAMNSQSSRSHAICTFSLKSVKTQVEEGISTTVTTCSAFHLVDLAGSERVKKTQATGDVFNEGVNINKGLLALGNVIVALSNGSGSHVPYRDSKITRILKDSLGGNSMTVMIACVSPADTNFEETLNSLRFAARVSCIVNNISLNKEYSGLALDDGNSSTNQQLLQEICHLREQLQLVQNKSQTSTSSPLDYFEMVSLSCKNHIGIDQIVPFIAFVKNILIKCLEDDVMVDNEILQKAQVSLNALKKTLSVKFSVPETEVLEGLEFDFLPPIMKLIESLEELERNFFHECEEKNGEEGRSSSGSHEIALETNTGLGLIEDVDNDHAENLELVSTREREVEEMMRLANQCKETISKLRQEVKTLEQEKQKAEIKSVAIEKSGKPPAAAAADAESLREKIRLLEAKQKELRKKEVEYAKLLTQKEKACEEVTRLRNELHLNKHLRVEAQKKARQEAEKFAEERKKLMHADNQMRKRELLAQEKVVKFSQELANKDRVMKSQLEEKEREIKRLKTINEKTEKVKNARESMISRRPMTTENPLNIKKGVPPKMDQLSTEQIVHLQGWLTREIDDQAWRNTLTEDIRIQNEERAICSKRLVFLKQQRERESNPSATVASRTEEEINRENEIKQLEEEMRSYAIEIAKLNGQLADLGVVVEKRRFCNITNLKEAKFLMQTMFQKLSVDVCLEKRNYEARIVQQEEEIRILRASLAQLEGSGHTSSEGKKKTKIPLPSESQVEKRSTKLNQDHSTPHVPLHANSAHNLSALMRPTTSSALHAKPKIREPKKPINATKMLRHLKPNPNSSNLEKTDSDLEEANDDSEISVSTSVYESDELDESFLPEDEISDFSDDEEPKRPEVKRSQNSKKRDSKELESDDYSLSSGSQQSLPKRQRSKSQTDSLDDCLTKVEMPSYPLSKYKVTELKKFLSDRSLPVSGRKDILISRLMEYLDSNSVPANDLESPELSLPINDENIEPLRNTLKKKVGGSNYLPLLSET